LTELHFLVPGEQDQLSRWGCRNMDKEHTAKAMEIRALALNFLDLAEITMLEDYKAKLLQTATRLTDAANALEDVAPHTRCA
jgi:hypothetical protein